MESFIRPPEPLKDNKAKTWIIWKEEFLIFMGLLGYMDRVQTFKANLFKNLIGSIGLEIINSLSFDCVADKENLDILLKKMDNYYYPQQTEAQKRNTFFNRVKKNDETMENYIQNLKERAKDCNFGTISDSLVRDVIILHTHDKILREKYMQQEKLTFDKIIAIYKNHKISDQEKKFKNVNVKSKDFKEEHKNKEVVKPMESDNAMSMQGNCWRCRTKHLRNKCPAWNYRCTKCNLPHHFEKCCRGQSQVTPRNLNMNDLDINKDSYLKDNKLAYNFDKNVYK